MSTMTEIERIDQLREELHLHNYKYYVENAPVISDQEFDRLMRELQDLEARHPEHYDPNSPSVRVGSDINKNFVQVEHRYPMLSLGNTYSQAEVTERGVRNLLRTEIRRNFHFADLRRREVGACRNTWRRCAGR